ncbi:MAG: HAD family hydrolase [Phycisphaerae bacterium]
MAHGVIFDMDGVLVASGTAHAASWRLVAKKHGLSMPDEFFRDTFGRPSRDIIRQVWNRELSDAEERAIDDEKERVYRDLVTGMVPLSIGAREALHALRSAGYTLAVGTSGPPENLELVLRETRIGDLFAATVHGFDVRHGKPAPDIFLLAAERARLAPRNCVVIEDAPVGLQGAQAAGMKTIGYAGTHPPERLAEHGADATIERFAELTPALVERVLKT